MGWFMALPTLLDLAGWVTAALVGCKLKQHTSIPPAPLCRLFLVC